MNRFSRSYKVRFEDCDLAGIVFFPHYFLMLNRLVEDWLADALGIPLSILHHERRLGAPTVNLQVAFKKTSRLDDILEWSLEVRRLGTKSLTLWVSARCRGEERITMEVIMVMVNLIPGGVSSLAIPSDIRTGMEKYLVEQKEVQVTGF